MPSPEQDAYSNETTRRLPLNAVTAPVKPSGVRHPTSAPEILPPSPSESGLPFRMSNPSVASLYASTFSPPGSRPMSPARQHSPNTATPEPVFDPYSGRGALDSIFDNPGEPLSQIIQSFVPNVSVYASEDTEILIKNKGIQYGLWELLRPFGEEIQGKISVRDSQGMSRSFEDFAIRFTRFGENIEHPDPDISNTQTMPNTEAAGLQGITERDRASLAQIESIVDRHLAFAECSTSNRSVPAMDSLQQGLDRASASPYYSLYLRRLLSGTPIVPHETFAHPVACVIAISSRNDAPIEELRKLYSETNQGSKRLPPWVDNDYLRYYILVHDEENDDINRSMGLFEQMKRHLGLHCHLLRLRCSKSAQTDDDSMPLPPSDWMPAAEELARIGRSENGEDFEDPTQYIFESDATAIRTFVREMVTQSIIPTMERHISIWNDQVASRRRGITGRFMNLSRKWTGFGGTSRSSSGGSLHSRDSYDTAGYYRADSAEAIIRKLADFAFMLRDWKLAHSTYELLRSDFSESKAWKYHAAANEMAAISLLIAPLPLTSKSRADSADQMLESAFYSYGTRCSSPFAATRCLLLAIELLRARGGTNIDDASRWGLRLLESRILGPVGDALLKERLCICYSSKVGVGAWSWGTRHRKAAVWSVLAAQAWNKQGKYLPAQRCLSECHEIYGNLPHSKGITQFRIAEEYIHSLEHEVAEKLRLQDATGSSKGGEDTPTIDVESQVFTDISSKRASIVSRAGVLETAPLRGEMLGG